MLPGAGDTLSAVGLGTVSRERGRGIPAAPASPAARVTEPRPLLPWSPCRSSGRGCSPRPSGSCWERRAGCKVGLRARLSEEPQKGDGSRGCARSGIVTPHRDCHPALGLSPRAGIVTPHRDSAPVRGVCALAALPARRLQNKTRNTPRPRHRFPPPPSKAEARRARLRPPPALRGRRGSGEGEPGCARLRSLRGMLRGMLRAPGSRHRPRTRSLLRHRFI